MADRNWEREDRERRWDRSREQEWAENRREERTNRGPEWERGSHQFGRRDEPEYWRDREEEERWRWRNESPEGYQRGGSGSEAGYGSERSFGPSHGYTRRGGGTGLRDDESWSVRNRERDLRRDYSYGGGMGGGFASAGSGWGGGMGGYSASMGTYMDRASMPSSYQSQGRFAGRGPKGWKRSDERIREDVNERLTMHPDIDATDVEVSVRDGDVTLTGVVDERHAKRLAEEATENISGVREVHNQIRVRRMHDAERYQSREQYPNRDQGLGSGFDTSTGNRGDNPLGLNQPPQGQQRQEGQQRQGQQYSGQQPGQTQNQPQNQFTGTTRGNR